MWGCGTRAVEGKAGGGFRWLRKGGERGRGGEGEREREGWAGVLYLWNAVLEFERLGTHE